MNILVNSYFEAQENLLMASVIKIQYSVAMANEIIKGNVLSIGG